MQSGSRDRGQTTIVEPIGELLRQAGAHFQSPAPISQIVERAGQPVAMRPVSWRQRQLSVEPAYRLSQIAPAGLAIAVCLQFLARDGERGSLRPISVGWEGLTFRQDLVDPGRVSRGR